MARSSTPLFFSFFIFFLIFTSSISSIQSRKLLNSGNGDGKGDSNKLTTPTLEDMRRLFLDSLPKGKTPSSTPTHKGHSVTIDEKLIARHLAAVDRILRSVPSPGVGH